MIFSICQSILIQTETNIVLNNNLHQLVRAPHDAGLFGAIFLCHEQQNSVDPVYRSNAIYVLQNQDYVLDFDEGTIIIITNIIM